MMSCAITNLPRLLRILLAECPDVGLCRDSSSAGRRFDPYTAHQTALRTCHSPTYQDERINPSRVLSLIRDILFVPCA